MKLTYKNSSYRTFMTEDDYGQELAVGNAIVHVENSNKKNGAWISWLDTDGSTYSHIELEVV